MASTGRLSRLRGSRDRPAQADEDPGGGTRESPLEVAKRRYAAGEIDRKEFEFIRRDLEAS